MKDKDQPHYYDLVYSVVRQIPIGRVSNYGAIADYLALGSARMVGWALNKCHWDEDAVPAHRVVNRLGELSGRHMFPTPTLMQERLEAEGVAVVDDKVRDWNTLFWHPEALDEGVDLDTPSRSLDRK
jgi:methylated-DNA-protein-cysteine methyltransferase-like protein